MPKDSDFIGLSCHLVVRMLSSSPGDANVQPTFRTRGVIQLLVLRPSLGVESKIQPVPVGRVLSVTECSSLLQRHHLPIF